VPKRGRILLRVTAVGLLAVAVVLVLLARPSDDRADAAPAPLPPLRTSLFSARRVPQLFATQAANAKLQRDLAAAVAGQDACVAVDADAGPVARVNATTPLAPASNLKLLTATAALQTFGPEHRFSTRVYKDGNEIVVEGGGDPMITSKPVTGRPFTPVDELAAKIAATGEHPSAIVVSGDRFDPTRFPPDWKSNYPSEGEAGAIGALTIDAGYESPGIATTDPALLFGQKLQAALAARGVNVPTVRKGAVPSTPTTIATLDSPRLDAIVEDMLRDSDNYTAEMLTKAMGAQRAQNGSTPAGDDVIISTLKELGVPTAGVSLHDGSGLAPTDRATCDALLGAVELAKRPKFAAIDKGLPVAGQTGTLATRFRGDPLAGKLRAKTGFIDNVAALSGVIDTPAHPRFAFIGNGGFSQAAGHDLQDRVARVVAAYPQPVDLKSLVPQP
jgi:D-alanyl-D-alanine carboxypeptidase/D-alanyl-D-alanine-endopeptidase (penicillin-binding protein 4)